MIAYVKGKITEKNPTYVVMETGSGVGYHINISLNTYTKIESLNTVQLFTHLYVKEDSHTLYGFFADNERKLFRLLISVSGIGPNTARIILSSMTPPEVAQAIVNNNVAAFKKVKGVGPKTAQRVILDLRDKVEHDPSQQIKPIQNQNTELMNQAGSALLALGFNKIQVQKAIFTVIKANNEIKTVEDLIKLALKQLS